MYAKIIDGKVYEWGRCPETVGIITNFREQPEEVKNEHGWFLVDRTLPVVNDWQTYHETNVVLVDGIPTMQYEIITKTVEELKEQKIKQLDSYVKPKFPTIQQQLNAQSKKPPKSYKTEKIDKILDDTKFWKDWFDDKEIEILALETEQEILDFDILTPEDRIIADNQEDLI